MIFPVCPKCEKVVRHINAQAIDVKDGTKNWKGGAYTCPHCHTILSAGLDPLALLEETVRQIRNPGGR